MSRRYKRVGSAKKRIFMLMIFAAVSLGLAFGHISEKSGKIDMYLKSGLPISDKAAQFYEGLLKHGKIAVIIWLMAFLPAGSLIAAGFIFIRVFACGFTMAVMLKHNESYGAVFIGLLYISQLLVIPSYVYLVCKCAEYNTCCLRGDENMLVKYFAVLALGLVASAIASVIDVLLIPVLCGV